MIRYLILVLFLSFLNSCGNKQVALPSPSPMVEEQKAKDFDDIKKDSYRARNGIPADRGRYEGSLWEDEASWGNLLRDHRARFRGDLVKITNLQDVITVTKPKESVPPVQPTPLATAGEAAAAQATQVVEAIAGISKAEQEQNEVLESLKSISAYVQSVLPNGNMVIVGEKVDYRQQNTIRYVTTIKGIIRPADVNEANEVQAIKLARFEPKIKRQMLARSLTELSPVIGQKKAGLLDRLSHIVSPSKGSSLPVTTK